MTHKIIGIGSYLPSKVVTNKDLEKFVDTTAEWIESRTGICQRHIAEDNEYASSMGLKAAEEAIKDAGIDKREIDLIIVATTTQDSTFPSTASIIQAKLGIDNVPTFDIQAVCSGFIYGMHFIRGMLDSFLYKTVLFVCTEKMSSIIDFKDRTTSVLFGDGAAAVIVKREDTCSSRVIDSKIYSEGSLGEFLYTSGGVSRTKDSGYIIMNGREVYKHAVEKMCSSANEILTRSKLKIEDITYFIPHQANARIIHAVRERLGLKETQTIITVDHHANCSAASIPLALSTIKSKLKRGDIILMTAVGAGLTYGAMLLSY